MQDSNSISERKQGNFPRPALAELERARPYRSPGPPERTKSHKANILKFWIECAKQGRAMLGSELYEHPESYGRSPRNRISELKKDGYIFESKPRGSNDHAYTLLRGPNGEVYAASKRAATLAWFEEQFGAGTNLSQRKEPHPFSRPFSPKRMAQDDCFRLTPPTFDKGRP